MSKEKLEEAEGRLVDGILLIREAKEESLGTERCARIQALEEQLDRVLQGLNKELRPALYRGYR